MKIWKYACRFGLFSLDIPEPAKILAFQTQDDTPCIWALVEPNGAEKRKNFLLIGTGHEIPPNLFLNLNYIGTTQDGNLVWHLFEVC